MRLRLPWFGEKVANFEFSKKAKSTGPTYIYGSKALFESKGKLTDTIQQAIVGAAKEGEMIVPHGNRKWDMYNLIYNTVPIAANAVDNIVNFATQSGFELEGDKEAVDKVWEWIDKNSFTLTRANIMRQELLFGNSYSETFTGDGGEYQTKLLPPKSMYVVVSTGDSDNGKVIGYKQIANIQKPVPFTTEEIVHFKWKDNGIDFYGNSEFECVLGSLERLLNYEENVGRILDLYAHPLRQHKIGTEDSPATTKQVADYISMLNDRDPGDDLVTSWAVAIEDLVPNLRLIQPDGLIKMLQDEVIAGLKVPEVFVRGGASSNKATADVELQSFIMFVKAVQRHTDATIEKGIFSKIVPGKEVRIVCNEILIEDESKKSQSLVSKTQAGVPLKIALQMAGWGSWVNDVEEEIKKNPPIVQPTNPQNTGNPGKTAPKKKPEPKEFANDADYIEAFEKWKIEGSL